MELKLSANIYLAKLYLKNFFITLLGLELFFLLIDYLQNQKNIPDSANLLVLYFYYQSFAALKITLSLSLVFGALWSLAYLVRSNEMTAFESIGLPKRKVLSPFVCLSFVVSILYIGLNFTPVGYYYDEARGILGGQGGGRSGELFFKYKNEFIYIKKLNTLSKTAEDMRIIGIEGKRVNYHVVADFGKFENDSWTLKNVKIIYLNNAHQPFIKEVQKAEVKTLDGFKPKILDNISNYGEGLNIVDAVNAIILLKNQSINTDKIKASLLNALFLPLFAPLTVMLIAGYTPTAARSFIASRFVAVWLFYTVAAWGVLTTLTKLTFYGALSSYLPIFVLAGLGVAGYYVYRRAR